MWIFCTGVWLWQGRLPWYSLHNVCVCVYMNVYTCMRVCVYIYIYTCVCVHVFLECKGGGGGGGESMGRGRKDRKKWFCMETASQFLMEHVCVTSLCMTDCRYSYNIPISDVHQAVTKVLVEMPLKENPTAQGKVSLAAVLRVSSRIPDYFMISSEKLKHGWILTTSQYTKTHILKLKEQLLKIPTLHNKQTSNLHTHTHMFDVWMDLSVQKSYWLY